MNSEKRNKTSARLDKEIQLLYRAESEFKVPAAPVIRRLTVEEDRPLPDRLPEIPEQESYQWPMSGSVDFTSYWRAYDREFTLMNSSFNEALWVNE